MMSAPGRVAGEKERKSCRFAIVLGDDAAKARHRAETVAQQAGFGRHYFIRLAFIERKFADEAQNQAHVVRNRRPYGSHFAGTLSGFGCAASHLSKGSEKAKSSCCTPFASV